MRKTYIDSDFKCHVTNDGTMREVETDAFDGMCDDYIEGFRLVPFGESWTRSDGTVFYGEMIAPWKDYAELDAIQREYERQLLAEYQENSIPVSELEAAYQEGVNSAYG